MKQKAKGTKIRNENECYLQKNITDNMAKEKKNVHVSGCYMSDIRAA